jgi:hypothetical protein
MLQTHEFWTNVPPPSRNPEISTSPTKKQTNNPEDGSLLALIFPLGVLKNCFSLKKKKKSVVLVAIKLTFIIQKNSMASVRKRTIATELPPHVGEVCDNFCGYRVSRGQRNGSPRPLISVF